MPPAPSCCAWASPRSSSWPSPGHDGAGTAVGTGSPSLGLSVLLAFIGVKLILHALHENTLPFINGGEHVSVPEISTLFSLGAIVVILGVTTVASLWKSNKDAKQGISSDH